MYEINCGKFGFRYTIDREFWSDEGNREIKEFLLLLVILLMYIFKRNLYHFILSCNIYINFVGDKPWRLYVLDNYFEFIYRLLYVLICKTKYFRTNII